MWWYTGFPVGEGHFADCTSRQTRSRFLLGEKFSHEVITNLHFQSFEWSPIKTRRKIEIYFPSAILSEIYFRIIRLAIFTLNGPNHREGKIDVKLAEESIVKLSTGKDLLCIVSFVSYVIITHPRSAHGIRLSRPRNARTHSAARIVHATCASRQRIVCVPMYVYIYIICHIIYI